jgi:hypothetical protein
VTYFLDAPKVLPKIKGNGPDLAATSFVGGLGASFSKSQLENDSNFRAGREKISVETDIARKVAEKIGLDPLLVKPRENGAFTEMRPEPKTIDEAVSSYGFVSQALKYARDKAQENPADWADFNLSEDFIQTEVNNRLQAEYQDLEQTLAMMPNGSGMAEFLGGMAGITVDVKNLPFMLFGGGSGSVVRIAGREAAINMAAEAAFMPAQFDMAKRLDIPDPNVPLQLTMAAGAGGLLGGGFEAARRGVTYWKLRNKVRSDSVAPTEIELQALVDQSEDILDADTKNPFEAIKEVSRKNPPNPLNPERPPLVSDRIKTSRIPGDPVKEPLPIELIKSEAEGAIQEAEAAFNSDFPEMRFKQPLAQAIIGLGGVKYRMLNRATGDMVLTPVARELAAMGVTPKTHPFIWRKTGRSNLDNIVASETEGLGDIVGVDANGVYLDEDGLTRALGEELSSGIKTPMSAEISARQAELESIRSQANDLNNPPEADFVSGRNSEAKDGLYIDLNQYHFDDSLYEADGKIEQAVNEWMQRRGYLDALSDVERVEIISVLKKRGGDAEILVDRMLEREVDFAELPAREVSDYEEVPIGVYEADQGLSIGEPKPQAKGNVGPSAEGAGRQGQDPKPARSGTEGAGNDRGPVSETTGAGDQTLIDGVQPISQRDRLEAAQNRALRGSDAPADDGLFDVTGRSQTDMFSDPASPEAKVAHDSVASDLRTEIESNGDFAVGYFDEKENWVGLTAADGRRLGTASEVLDEIEAGQNFSEIIDLCGRPSA